MRAAKLVTFGVFAITSQVAAAQPGAELSPPGLTPSTASAEPADPKEPGTGVLLASLGTAAPFVILAAGWGSNDGDSRLGAVELATTALILAPSAGHWYAGKFWSPGMGLRLAGLGVAAIGLVDAIHGDESSNAGLDELMVFGGLTVAVAGALYDIADASRAVKDWNRAHAVGIQPTMMRTGQGYGVGFAGAF